MVKSVVQPLRRWPAVESLISRLGRLLTTWPGEDFGSFVSGSIGTGMAGGVPGVPQHGEGVRNSVRPTTAPAAVEMRFMKLHAEGRFDEMWDMIAEDAQRAWGGREPFVREMPRLDEDTELLDMQTMSVAVLEGWTDEAHHRTYSNVARLVMRYRVRQQWREWTFDRQVHLVPAAGGWRTLCYPTRARTAAGR
jgi:hypothetical protein